MDLIWHLGRFFRFVEFRSRGGCWIWKGHRSPIEPKKRGGGYGMFWTGTTMMLAHRWIYTQYYGAIPAGMTVDHRCQTPACVNPRHLRVASIRENILWGTHNPAAINAKKTHCPAGHPYSPENTYHQKNRARRCRSCLARRRRQGYYKARGLPVPRRKQIRRVTVDPRVRRWV